MYADVLNENNQWYTELYMDVAFFKPFVEGTLYTLKVQCSVEASAGKPFYKGQEEQKSVEIAGIIGLASKVFAGSIAICFPKNVFLMVMSRMMGEEYTEINDEVRDGASELLNIIYGQAKKVLNEKGYGIEKAIPTVINGNDLKTHYMTKDKVIVLPFTTDNGDFYIEISAEPKSL